MEPQQPVDEQGVAALARAAELSIDSARLPLVAAQLGQWLTAANELNMKMADRRHRDVTPITVFGHLVNTETAE